MMNSVIEKYEYDGGTIYKTKIMSLTNISLNVIIQNFECYLEAFNTTNNAILRKNLTFLQKKHSEFFIKMLTSGNLPEIQPDLEDEDLKDLQPPDTYLFYLKEKYFDFLLNENMKELNMGLFEKKDWKSVQERMTTIGPCLEEVTFHFNNLDVSFEDRYQQKRMYLSEFVHKIIPSLKHVKVLHLSKSTKCDDTTLWLIFSFCKELQNLNVHYCPITINGLDSLLAGNLALANLKSLTLGDDKYLSFENVAYLLKNVHYLLPSLESISFRQLQDVLFMLHVAELRSNSLASSQKYNLTSLNLRGLTWGNFYKRPNESESENIFLIVSAVCPYLKKLEVFGLKRPEHLEALSRFQNLSELDLRFCSSTSSTIDPNRYLATIGCKLRVLNLATCKISVSLLIQNCPNLEKLSLFKINYLLTEKVDSVNKLSRLYSLSLAMIMEYDVCPIEESLYILFASSQNLKELKFFCCDIKRGLQLNHALKNFCGSSTSLEKLSFIDTEVEDDVFEQVILTCTTLKTLLIGSMGLGPWHDITLENFMKICNSNIKLECFFGKYDDDKPLIFSSSSENEVSMEEVSSDLNSSSENDETSMGEEG